MAVNTDNEKAPQNPSVDEGYLRKLMLAINRAIDGKSNNGGEFSLTPSSNQTIVKNKLCGPGSVVILQAVSSGAATAIGVYVVANSQSFTVFHDINTSALRKFRYVITG